jgi:uncharacterized protein
MKQLTAIVICMLMICQASLAQTKGAPTKPAHGTTPSAAKEPKGPVHLHVRVLAKAYEDSIVIRWAPGNAVAWTLGKDSGYRIARIDYSDPQHPVTTLLSSSLFRPMSLDQMKATLDHNDKYAAIAAQALYGNDFRMTKQEPVGFAKKVKQEHDVLNFRYSFALQAADFSAPVASALALRWVDKDVKKGGSYIYVVTVPGGNKNYVVDSAASYIANIKEKSGPVPEGLQGYGFDRQVELHWNRRQSGNFSAYFIERSDDGGKTFHALNKLPFYAPDQTPANPASAAKKDSSLQKVGSLLRDHQVYVDSVAQDYHPYYYRVRGINAFAELSPYSVAVVVQGRDLTPPVPPVIDSAKNLAGGNIDISWTQRTPAPDLAGYYISRANSVQGPFTPITRTLLPPGTRRFTDSAALPHVPNYYVVIAVDTAKNVSASAAHAGYLTDTIPPAAPALVAGTIDSSGVVRLHWAANRETDLKGYKVYYAYGQKDQFSQLNPGSQAGSGAGVLSDTSFTDTISMKSLNRRIWYKVVAVDRSGNHSAYSAPAVLKKIIVVPPSAPVAGNIDVKGHRVAIEWIESRSEGAAGYQVMRKGPGADSTWTPVASLHQDWSRQSLLFIDSTIVANTDYYYAAQTIDSTGCRSGLSFAVHVRNNAADSIPSLANLQAKLDGQHHHVSLSWQYKDTGDYFFVVYRSVNNGTLDAWRSFDKNLSSGEDDQVSTGTYNYAIKIVHRDRPAVSAVSKPVQLLIQ